MADDKEARGEIVQIDCPRYAVTVQRNTNAVTAVTSLRLPAAVRPDTSAGRCADGALCRCHPMGIPLVSSVRFLRRAAVHLLDPIAICSLLIRI